MNPISVQLLLNNLGTERPWGPPLGHYTPGREEDPNGPAERTFTLEWVRGQGYVRNPMGSGWGNSTGFHGEAPQQPMLVARGWQSSTVVQTEAPQPILNSGKRKADAVVQAVSQKKSGKSSTKSQQQHSDKQTGKGQSSKQMQQPSKKRRGTSEPWEIVVEDWNDPAYKLRCYVSEEPDHVGPHGPFNPTVAARYTTTFFLWCHTILFSAINDEYVYVLGVGKGNTPTTHKWFPGMMQKMMERLPRIILRMPPMPPSQKDLLDILASKNARYSAFKPDLEAWIDKCGHEGVRDIIRCLVDATPNTQKRIQMVVWLALALMADGKADCRYSDTAIFWGSKENEKNDICGSYVCIGEQPAVVIKFTRRDARDAFCLMGTGLPFEEASAETQQKYSSRVYVANITYSDLNVTTAVDPVTALFRKHVDSLAGYNAAMKYLHCVGLYSAQLQHPDGHHPGDERLDDSWCLVLTRPFSEPPQN